MIRIRWPIAALAITALLGTTPPSRAADDVGIDALPDGTFIHKDSKTVFKAPTSPWTVIAPYRLRKSTSSTVLGLEKWEGDKPQITMTVVWSPNGDKPFTDIINSEGDNLGEEHATLATVYGRGKVGLPSAFKVGSFTVFKVLIDDGPDRDGRFAGAMYLFESGPADKRWKVKIRAIYPALNREEYMKQVEEVIKQFSKEE